MQELGLQTSGLKPELVERLYQAGLALPALDIQSPAQNPPPPSAPSPSQPSLPMVMQFDGLSGALERLASPEEEKESNALQPDSDDDLGELEIESKTSRQAETGEDGLIMAEAWINLHFDRQERSRSGKDGIAW